MDLINVAHSDPEILSGTPVHSFIDYLEAGDSLDTFLDHFPSVRREQAVAALELAKKMLVSRADSLGR
jgi:uncharacterized protein (DUF433 family)